MKFSTDCVRSTASLICPMVDGSRQITRRTFLRHVDRDSLREIEDGLGYEGHPKRGLTMAGDYHVLYFKGYFAGQPCVFFDWSSIEHVFI